MLTVIWFRVMNGHFTPQRNFGFEAVSWYWHFVDVVWLGLFIFVYWL
jgi:cytochrome c oxidase subunit 3